MRNIVKQNKQFLLAFFGVLLIILSCSIFVSNSDMLTEEVVIKSIVPVYDENDTYSVGNTGVIFNDKEQVVKYNIVIENRKNYDVKITDLQLSTPTEDFLNYTVENVNVDDVIKAGESKELVVSFETVKMDGWGRNFNDELVTTLVFDEVKKQEEVVVPPVVDTKPDTNVPTNKVENNNSINTVQPEVNEPVVNEPVIEQPKEEVNNDVVTTPEDDANHELGMNQEIIVKDSNTGDLFVIFCFGVATGVLGIGLVMVNKNKFTKYIVLFIVVGSSVKLAQADEIMSLEIPINVSYESQNVMQMAYKPERVCETYEKNGETYEECWDECEPLNFWVYAPGIKNFYIENELKEFKHYTYKFDVSEEENGRVIAYVVELENLGNSCFDWDNNASKCYDLYLQADGIIYSNIDAGYYFADMYSLEKLENLNGIDTRNTTNMSYMFAAVGANVKNFALDLSSLDTGNVTSMSRMFISAGSYSDDLVIDLRGLNTSNVTNMECMFCSVGLYSENLEIYLNGLDTSNVTNMSGLFSSAGDSSKNVKIEIDGIDTSNVTNMSYMFRNVGARSTSLSLDVSGLDTRNVTNMEAMFFGTGGYNKSFVLDVSNLDTSNLLNANKMFWYTGYDSSLLNMSITITNPNIDSYANMFGGVATRDGAQIIVNYTNKTSDLVDRMIATKSSNSNVVKGWNVDNEMISFDIEGTTYNAIEGMTWEQWVNSEYNTDGYYILNSWVALPGLDFKVVTSSDFSHYIGNVIVAGYSYMSDYLES